MERMVNIGLIQMSSSADVEKNFNKTVSCIREAARRGANIVCTQELFKSRYFCQVTDSSLFSLAEKIDEHSGTIKTLCELAAGLEIVIIASLFEKRATGLYHNTAVVIDADGSYLGKYRKMHIPDDPLFYEKFYFTPGDLGYKVFRTRYAEVGVLICWDQWFPEAARLTAMQGAEIIFYPTAIGFPRFEGVRPGITDDHDAWEIVQRGHAVANGCYVATANRVAFEENSTGSGIDFWGRSFIANPDGEVLKRASADSEEILSCPVDLSFVEQVRDGQMFPFRDRRVDSYSGLTKLYLD